MMGQEGRSVVSKRLRVIDRIPLEAMSRSSDLPPRGEMDKMFDRLIDQVKNDDISDIPRGLLELKALHRQLFGKIQRAEAGYNKKVSQTQKRLRTEEALQYERKQLEHRIDLLKTFSTPHLIQLARDEAGINADDKLKSDAEILREYFHGRDISNPADRDHILQRLHQEINARGKLEQTVKTKKDQLGKLLKEVKSATQQLTSIPQHVAAIERASLPLQKMFPDSLVGTDRKHRFDQAQTLPTPLYVLLQQLQQVVDDDRDEKTRPTLSVDRDQVLLHLPVTDPSSASVPTASKPHSKKVTIHFAYEEQSNMVTASPSGCVTLLLQDVLLHDLFPGDTPPNASRQRALPYHWCNYMAGIHLLPQTQHQPAFASTRVILAELQRRVRANATLKYSLQSFQRGSVPSLPGLVVESLPFISTAEELECKLSGFESLDSDSPLVGEYIATVVKNGDSLKARVRIHMARYPATPPEWSLAQSETLVNGSSNFAASLLPLHDASLADLERRVNVWLLEQITRGTSSSPQIYEWILVLQLREIMSLWTKTMACQTRERKRKTRD